MNKTRVDISTIISPDLKSRSVVRDFDLYLRNLGVSGILVDFANVKFATRSFIDEFYNTFMKPGAGNIEIELENVPSDLVAVFDAVKTTQKRPKSKNNTGSVVYLDSMNELKKFFNTLTL